jgi:hypothetical protein
VRRPLLERFPGEDLAAAIVLAAAGLMTWWMAAADFELAVAWRGWSAIDWVNHRNLPENFARDFPNGMEAYEKSAILQIYPLAHGWLGIPAQATSLAVLALELAAIALAAWLLVRALFERRRLTIAATLFALLVASYGPNLDLARFGIPYGYGLFYYTAEACRLAAIACALRGRYAASGLLLGLAAVNHPLMALYGAFFVAATMALEPRRFLSRGALAGAGLMALVALPWFLARYLSDPAIGLVATGRQHELWLPLMRALSYHYFPVQLGVFAEFAAERFLPLFSFFALFAHYLTRVELPAALAARLTAGMLAMALLTAAGVLLSEIASSPTAIKLALHRASLVAVLVALPVVVAGLWRDMVGSSLLRRFLAAGALLSAFSFQPGWPLLFTLGLCAAGWLDRTGRHLSPADYVAGTLALAAAALAVYYHRAGLVPASAFIYWASPAIWKFAVIFVVLSVLCGRLAVPEAARAVSGLVLVLSACAMWLAAHALTADQKQLYTDFKAAQEWARDHTRRDALFMVDPTIYYGWREFSQRSSFGNLREWLHTSWVYVANTAAFEEGYRRFGEFGIELAPHLGQRPSVIKGGDALTEKVRERYNTAGDDWRRAMTDRYGVDYFVVSKRHWKASSTLPVAFENDSFRVLGAGSRP